MTGINRRDVLLSAAGAALLVGCGGGGDDGQASEADADSPGKIAGLGSDKSSVRGREFVLPAGIETVNGWFGLYMGLRYQTAPNTDDLYPMPLNPADPLKDDSAGYGNVPLVILQGDPVQATVGLGIGVTARVPLVNRTDKSIEVVFPAGLVLPSKLPMYQSGVLLTDSRVAVPAGTEVAVALATLGGNWHLAGSTPGALYEPGVVSSSATLNELVDLLRGKRLAYEMYEGDYAPYWEIAVKMQGILGRITDSFVGLDDTDRTWIKSLPDA